MNFAPSLYLNYLKKEGIIGILRIEGAG